jgi:phosphoribosylamine--glycine ligase
MIVGSGGREHALVRALARSPARPELLCAPGNAGIGADARLVDVAVENIDAIVETALREQVELTVVGPEAPLVAGLVDALAEQGARAFGPTAAAARLEGSKSFAKEVMAEAAVPTARWRRVASLDEGLAAAGELGCAARGVVVKADGLAAGKGVTVADDTAQARGALEEIFVRERFGAGAEAVVEERLRGEELSLLALCDGERAVPMASARDYKRIFDGDRGPNTGGMGSFSPVEGFGAEEVAKMAAQVHQPVIDHLGARGTPFHGVLYAGLMLTEDGPKVLEFNVRFGDPETQAVLPRLRSDLLELLLAATERGGLAQIGLDWSPAVAVTVVLASAGYPTSSSPAAAITGLEELSGDVELTHAATALKDGRTMTAGGRVLNVTALGVDRDRAREAAYAAARGVSFEGMQLRRDIAAKPSGESTVAPGGPAGSRAGSPAAIG